MTVALRQVLFTALYGCARALERAATLGFHAAAGATRLADLRASIELEWDRTGASQWDDYVAFGLMTWERDFYLRFIGPGDRVLVAGCGTGRDLLALLELGYRAEGVDVSPRCTAAAREWLHKRGWSVPVHTGAIETFAVPGHFDAFILSWFCYSYIPGSAARIQLLRKLRDHLNPGGRILATYAPASPLPRRLPIRLAQLVAWLSRSDWHPEYGDIIRVANPGRYFEHYEHRFTRDTLEEEARAAALAIAFHGQGDVGRALLTPAETPPR